MVDLPLHIKSTRLLCIVHGWSIRLCGCGLSTYSCELNSHFGLSVVTLRSHFIPVAPVYLAVKYRGIASAGVAKRAKTSVPLTVLTFGGVQVGFQVLTPHQRALCMFLQVSSLAPGNVPNVLARYVSA